MLSLISKQRALGHQLQLSQYFSLAACYFGTRKRDLRKPYEMKSPTPKTNLIVANEGYFMEISFSHKKAIHTYKANIHRKRIYSETLDMKIRMYVSSKALKTMTKKGGLDQYLLNTNPKHIDSKFGMYLKEAIVHKQENPDEPMLFIPGQKRVKKSRSRPQKSSFGGRPAIYQAPQFRVRPDFLHTARKPAELRMRERQEFYKQFLQAKDQPQVEEEVVIEGKVDQLRSEDGSLLNQAILEDSEEIPRIKREQFDFSKVSSQVRDEIEFLKPQVLQMLPFRHAAIKQELLKYKNKRGKLLTLFGAIDESQTFIERLLQDQYVGFFERYPDLAQIFIEIAKRDQKIHQKISQRFGNRDAILGPDGVKLDQQLLESGLEGKGAELTTTLDYHPKLAGLKKTKKERIKDVKKKFDHK